MNDQKAQDWSSRKYRSAWKLTLIFVGLLVIPAIVTLILHLVNKEIQFSILPIEAFVTFLTLIWAAYFGANITEKHKAFIHKSVVTNTVDTDKDDDFGGQPEASEGNES